MTTKATKATKTATKRFCFTRAQLENEFSALAEEIYNLKMEVFDTSPSEMEEKLNNLYNSLINCLDQFSEEKE